MAIKDFTDGYYFYFLTLRQKEELERLNALPENVITYEKIPEE